MTILLGQSKDINIFYVIKANTQGMLQFTGLGYVGPKQAGW